jgi:hypothetical protein
MVILASLDPLTVLQGGHSPTTGTVKKIDVGEDLQSYLPIRAAAFVDHRITAIGYSDTFGRTHWAPKAQVKAVGKRAREEK